MHISNGPFYVKTQIDWGWVDVRLLEMHFGCSNGTCFISGDLFGSIRLACHCLASMLCVALLSKFRAGSACSSRPLKLLKELAIATPTRTSDVHFLDSTEIQLNPLFSSFDSVATPICNYRVYAVRSFKLSTTRAKWRANICNCAAFRWHRFSIPAKPFRSKFDIDWLGAF